MINVRIIEFNIFIIKLCIDLNLQSNIKYFCKEFIIHKIYYEIQYNDDYITLESLLDYSLHKNQIFLGFW